MKDCRSNMTKVCMWYEPLLCLNKYHAMKTYCGVEV